MLDGTATGYARGWAMTMQVGGEDRIQGAPSAGVLGGLGRRSLLWLVAVFVCAVVPRVVYPVSRAMLWYIRSVHFWDALVSHNWAGTYQQYHPGVTPMWVAGLGLRVYAWAKGWTPEQLIEPPLDSAGVQHYPVEAGVAALAIAVSICICLCSWIVGRLLGTKTGIASGFFLAFDPFYIARSKVLHVDSLLATLMLTSALLALSYARYRSRAQLVLSGIIAGLAFLAQSPSGFLVPFVLILLAVTQARLSQSAATANGTEIRGARSGLSGFLQDAAVWSGAAVIVFVLLWPAMWVNPEVALAQILERALFHAETPHHNPVYFAGDVVTGNLGVGFYLAVVLWKTTLVALPAIGFGAAVACRDVLRSRTGSEPIVWVLGYALCFTAIMTCAARKEARYLLPVFPPLDVVAAWGLAEAGGRLGRRLGADRADRVGSTFVAAALLLQAGVVLRYHPYYDAHANSLLGGPGVAQHILPRGDQEEGLELAAQYLNSAAEGRTLTAGVQRRGETLFARFFAGHTRGMGDDDVDFWVFGVNSTQRRLEYEEWAAAWQSCNRQGPVWSFAVDGVRYAWICRAYADALPSRSTIHPVEARMGEHFSLVGYQPSSDQVPAGDQLAVTLYWRTIGWPTNDAHVFVHLLDAGGRLVAQHDGAPGGGQRPTWSWRDGEVVTDVHTVSIGGSLPPGTYALSTGMYDVTTGERLDVVLESGVLVPDRRVPLADITVIGR